jgi:hypothetical protein
VWDTNLSTGSINRLTFQKLLRIEFEFTLSKCKINVRFGILRALWFQWTQIWHISDN